ncbi:hypothetical protein HYS50_01315 [Candidatus Woesearchaeota archaeon]|nr:hypothetical protein [Candidatus Woesearchaeota archaeon]
MPNTLTIHLHEVKRQDEVGLELLEFLVEQNQNISLGLGVDNLEAWQRHPRCFAQLKLLIAAPNVELVQRGFRNRCPKQGTNKEHTIRDFYHENRCSSFFSRAIDAHLQQEGMKRGKNILEATLEKTPIAYCPPNGLYDRETIRIAHKILEYKHFVMLGLLPAVPYRLHGNHLVIVTQTKLDYATNAHAFTHLDHLPQLQQRGLLQEQVALGLSPLSSIKKESWYVKQIPNRALVVPLNSCLRYLSIQARDLRRLLTI